VPARRVLITGVANFWGTRLALRLAAEPDVEKVVGVDTRRPSDEVREAIAFVEGDLRSPDLAPVVRAAAPDTICHNDVQQFPEPGRSARLMHDMNVVGTLQLLSACDGLSTLRTIVVRGSAAIYGSEPAAPAFFTEDLARRYPLRTRFQRDIGELESLVDTFARRHPGVTCTMLRMQPVLGTTLDTPITRLFRLRVIPTVMGFDPRMQFLHEDDSVEAVLAAMRAPVHGAVNVAGPGTVSLARVLRRLGRVSVPIPHPVFGRVAGAVARAGGTEMTEDIERYLRYGRGVDIRRLVDEVGFRPAFSSEGTVQAMAQAVAA
jgi:UDP-glucose 4-epimerase